MVNPDIYRKKQNWYKLFWWGEGAEYFHTNRNHLLYGHLTSEPCEPSPAAWYQGMSASGIDLVSAESPALTWYDIEILQCFDTHGSRVRFGCSTSGTRTEHLRQLALAEGHANIPLGRSPHRHGPGDAYTNWSLGRASLRRVVCSGGRFLGARSLP